MTISLKEHSVVSFICAFTITNDFTLQFNCVDHLFLPTVRILPSTSTLLRNFLNHELVLEFVKCFLLIYQYVCAIFPFLAFALIKSMNLLSNVELSFRT